MISIPRSVPVQPIKAAAAPAQKPAAIDVPRAAPGVDSASRGVETTRVQADKTLAGLFAGALRSGSDSDLHAQRIEAIPKDSLFGQWRAHLRAIMRTPEFETWAAANRIDLDDVAIFPKDGAGVGSLAYMDGGTRKVFDGAEQPQNLPAGWSLLMKAANVLVGDQFFIGSQSDDSASVRDVGYFYRQNLPDSRAGVERLAREWDQPARLLSLNADDPRSEHQLAAQQAELAQLTGQTVDLPLALRPRAGVEGDRALAEQYADALLECASQDETVDHPTQPLRNIDKHSSFGQWYGHLHTLLKSDDFRDWADRQGVDLSKPIKIFPGGDPSGTIRCTANGKSKDFGLSTQGPQLPQSWPLIMSTAKVLVADGGHITANPDGSAQLRDVAVFHGEANIPIGAKDALQQRAALIREQRAFIKPDPDDVTRTESVRASAALEHEQRQLGDLVNRRTLRRLFETPPAPGINSASSVAALLKNHYMSIHPDSSLHRAFGLASGATLSLEDFIARSGWSVPKNKADIENLVELLSAPPLAQLPYGDLGGALSWPAPLTAEDQRAMHDWVANKLPGSSQQGLFGYLARDRTWSPEHLRNPRQLLAEVLVSPDAQALGESLQAHFGGVATPSSVNDWLLAAIQTSLDQGAPLQSPSEPVKSNRVAGFDLIGQAYWGKPGATVVKGLTEHLVASQQATAAMAPVIAHLLLAHRAPALLVKDIPAQVTLGSHSWVSFSTAVARCEAQEPGSTAMMTYAQVMASASASPVSLKEQRIEQAAQERALKDWGVINGVLAPNDAGVYSDVQMTTLRTSFNTQISELKAAREGFSAPIPIRKEMAMKALREALGAEVPLEKKCISLRSPHRDHQGDYSILDLYMSNVLHNNPGYHTPSTNTYGTLGTASNANPKIPNEWVSSARDVNISTVLDKTKALPNIKEVFEKEFSTYCDTIEKSLSTKISHLIAKLPLEDRKKLEQGSLSMYRQTITDLEEVSRNAWEWKAKESHALVVKIESAGQSTYYEIDPQSDAILKLPGLRRADGNPNRVVNTEQVLPPGDYRTQAEQTAELPNTYFSNRTRKVAGEIVRNINFKGTQEAAAKGFTDYESEAPVYKKINEVLLAMVPLRSTILSFQKGDSDGVAVNLMLDIFGFVLAGFSAAGKTAAGLNATTSLSGTLSQAAKFAGRTAVGALNPLGGVDDLAVALGRGAEHALSLGVQKIRQLRGAAHSVDLAQATKKVDLAEGTFKALGSTDDIRLTAYLDKSSGDWFAFDAKVGRPYGKKIEHFSPDLPADKVLQEELKGWLDFFNKPVSPDLDKRWKAIVATNESNADFIQGYKSAKLNDISGYSSRMKAEQVMELTLNPNLTPKQIGALVRQRERLAVNYSLQGSQVFNELVKSTGGKTTPVSQIFYLSQTQPLSKGECAALSHAFAEASKTGKQQVLIDNLFKVSANPGSPQSKAFVRSLSDLQRRIEGATVFHGIGGAKTAPYTDIAKDLVDATASKTLMIGDKGHAMTAGVKIDGDKKTFFFFEPNYGHAEFPSADALSRGLDEVFASGKLPRKYDFVGANPKDRELKISVLTDRAFMDAGVNPKAVAQLYDTAL